MKICPICFDEGCENCIDDRYTVFTEEDIKEMIEEDKRGEGEVKK